jgi:hypothetical protein
MRLFCSQEKVGENENRRILLSLKPEEQDFNEEECFAHTFIIGSNS